MKKRKMREPRKFWDIKPITRVKESDRIYDRKKEKSKLRREDSAE